MTPEEPFGQFLGLGKAWRVVEARLEASTFVLKVEEMLDLWQSHVIQYGVEACDQIRKTESRADAGKRDQLERTRWMWLKNRENWTEKETLKWESMALERCVTGMAYEMTLVLQGIYERKDVEEARKLFGNWCAWVHAIRQQTGELLEPMARVARMIGGIGRESWPTGPKG